MFHLIMKTCLLKDFSVNNFKFQNTVSHSICIYMKTVKVSQEKGLRKGALVTQDHSKARKQIQSESVSTYLVNPENT